MKRSPSIKALVTAEPERDGVALDKRVPAALRQLTRGRPALFHRDADSYLRFLILVGRATKDLPFEDVCEYAGAFVSKVDRPFHFVKRRSHVVPDFY